MPGIAARHPSARLMRAGHMPVVEVHDADLALPLGMAEQDRRPPSGSRRPPCPRRPSAGSGVRKPKPFHIPQ